MVPVRELLVAGGLSSFSNKEPARMTEPAESEKLSYSVINFAKAVDLNPESIRREIASGKLTASYFGKKPLIRREEGERWLRDLPAEGTRGVAS